MFILINIVTIKHFKLHGDIMHYRENGLIRRCTCLLNIDANNIGFDDMEFSEAGVWLCVYVCG